MASGGDPPIRRSRETGQVSLAGWMVLALMLPVLGLAQARSGAPAASAAGAMLPGTAVPYGEGRAGPTTAPADYTNYGVSAGVGATDNVNYSATDRKSQALAATNLFFDLIRTGSRLQLNALGNFSDVDFLQHAYGNQVLGRFDGLAALTLWTHHLTWIVTDDYGNQQTDAFESMTPANLERVNIFSTGPDLKLQPTLSSYVDLQALYSRESYQRSPFGGAEGTGSVELGHAFSERSSISVVGEVQQLRFDNTVVNRNYQYREYYGRYRLAGARTTLELKAGDDQANDTGAWKSSPLLELSLTRKLSPFALITLAGGRDYSNAMGNFASLGASPVGISISPAAQTSANALHTYGNADWSFSRLRTNIELFGGWERDDYAREPIDNVTRANIGLSLGRQLTRLLTGEVTGELDRYRYVQQGFTDSFGSVGAGLVYRLGKRFVINGRYEHQFRRPSGTGTVAGRFDENRIFVMIGYYPRATGTGARAGGEAGAGSGFP